MTPAGEISIDQADGNTEGTERVMARLFPDHPEWHSSAALFNYALMQAMVLPEEVPPPKRMGGVAVWDSGAISTITQCIVKVPNLTVDAQNATTNAPDLINQFFAEMRVYRTVGFHPQLLRFLGGVGGIGLALERVDGDLLHRRLTQPDIPVSMKADWANQIIAGLAHIHSFGLSHGELSTHTIFIGGSPDARRTTVKLIDFGRSRVVGEPVYLTSPPFAAPEVLRQESDVDGILADAYSFAIVLFCVDAGHLPSFSPGEEQIDDALPDLTSVTLFEPLIRKFLRGRATRPRVQESDRVAFPGHPSSLL
ncbi:hypothetical protein BOTBODRAFT_347273 [Botryobasidium botryosum FD-172 SS1]|uniref:Protein kinase domain-containing protein n=1 Tax=Botryobasidium botryosum (strain FD-172 SS1) TaxID=930990 RepID=A0A067MRQ3_BOTB1|nr:hypothetical protein BOTBODRAFT_347273 [Botryobasidium botryosum FD-172 SS1]